MFPSTGGGEEGHKNLGKCTKEFWVEDFSWGGKYAGGLLTSAGIGE